MSELGQAVGGVFGLILGGLFLLYLSQETMFSAFGLGSAFLFWGVVLGIVLMVGAILVVVRD